MARGPLGVTRSGQSPSLTPPGPGTLDYALRSVRGGKYRVMELAPAAVAYEPALAPVVEAWHLMTPWQQRTTTLDDLVAEAGLSPGAFVGAVVRAAFETGASIAPLLVAAAFPDAMRVSVKRALTKNGVADRRLLVEYMDHQARSGPGEGSPARRPTA